jgi:protein ImuB
MSIPSYDDLAPAIPDISNSPGKRVASVAALLPGAGPVARRRPPGHVPALRGLWAALHGAPVERLAAIACEFSPRIERHPGGTVVLDVAGLQRLLGDAPAIASELVRAGAGHVAIASSYTAAMLLARARPGVTVATGDPETALREVPASVLQHFLTECEGASAGPQGRRPRAPLFDVLGRWGLTTLGEFAALPAGELAARLGPAGVAAQRLARGIDPRPLVPDTGVPRFLASSGLEWPIETLEPLSFVFARLLDPLAAALERADRGAVALHLALRLTDRTTHTRTVPLPVALRDPRVLRTLLCLDLESHPPSAAVDVVTIEIDPAPARILQYSLLERALPSAETLATLMARLGALVGDTRCGSPVLLDTHQPDAFAMAPFECADKGAVVTSRGAIESAVDHVSVLRRFRPPVVVRVSMDGGRPAHVAIDRRGMPVGTVQQAAGPWRGCGGWWTPQAWNRDEWDVALSDGTVCRLFRDRDTGQWCLDGVFD